VYIAICFPCSVTCLQYNSWNCIFCCIIVVIFGSMIDAAIRRVSHKSFYNSQITLTLQTPNAYYNLQISQHVCKLMWSLHQTRRKGRNQLTFSGGKGQNDCNLYVTNKQVFEKKLMRQLPSFPFLVSGLLGDKYMLNIKVLVHTNDLRGLRDPHLPDSSGLNLVQGGKGAG